MKKLFLFIFICFLPFTHTMMYGQVEKITDLTELNGLIDSQFANSRIKSKPVIGISAMRRPDGGSLVPGSYVNAVEKSGGIPFIIPVTTDGTVIYKLIEHIDGLLLTGGSDIKPSFYKEDIWNETVEVDSLRDIFDLSLIKMTADRNVPILGICRGEQLINVAFGGTLYQDIPTQITDSSINHRQTISRELVEHNVSIFNGTLLARILAKDTVGVNSFHHQSVKKIAPGFRVAAMAQDSVIEAIEAYPNKAVLGVQWHPEALIDNDPAMLKIFKFMVQQADVYKKAKEIHSRILTVDTHADTPLCFIRIPGYDFGKRENNEVNLPKMNEGMLDGIFLAAYMAQGKRDRISSENAVKHIDMIIDSIYSQVERNKDLCGIAVTRQDLVRLKQEGKKAIFIGIENGYGIGKDINNLKKFKARGVNYVTLCHTKDNDICDTSSETKNEWGGLSPFGHKVVQEMNRLGMIVDLSHTHENTFWDVIKESKAPVVVTHSSVRALCDHDRNLTDEQMKALAKNNGVMQLCPVDIFVTKGGKDATLEQFMDHIDYAVKLIGIDHVGIGSDFDGGGGLIGLRGANDMINITVKLLERGYSEEDIAKIWGGNFMRVLDDVQAKADVKTFSDIYKNKELK